MKLYKIIPAAFAATVALALATTVNAATWYVNSSTGNDANDCMTATTACMTITAAVTKASSGDTISVADGSYPELVAVTKTLTINGDQHGVDARSRSGAESVVGSPIGAFQIEADNVTIDGFTIQGVTADQNANPAGLGAGIWMNPGFSSTHGGAQILNNIIQNNIIGIEFDNDGTIPAKVQFNLIQNNNVPGAGSGSGIETNFGLMNATIDNNKFVGQTGSSILVVAPSSSLAISNNTLDAGIAMLDVNGSTITGNSSIGNVLGAAIDLFGGNSNIVINNNVLDNGKEGVVVENPYSMYGVLPNSGITVSPNNCIAGNSVNGMRVDSGAYTGSNINATNNWWGAASGPKYNGAGPGTGDNIADPGHVVTYTPFLTVKNGTPCFVAVGPPTTANQCKNGAWQTFNTPRTFKNQGDCIQYVNTGK